MRREGAVAGLASDSLVPASVTRGDDVAVALGARLAAGVAEPAIAVVVEGARPVVPVVAEVGRDEQGARSEERHDAGEEKAGKAEEMLSVAEGPRHGSPPFPVGCTSRVAGRELVKSEDKGRRRCADQGR